MSKMELRSSRSRSRTPFMSEEFEASANGKHVEKVMTRTTRRTTVVKTNEFASSSTDEVTSKDTSKFSRKSMAKSEKSLRNHLLKSSNYSFEDGENEVSSSKTIRQNERNQLLEDASNLNGSESPALDLYRRSGRYWEIYPKTDWTYSQHSKDRVEIAPGVVAMPNMSRKTIHNLDESSHESYEFLKKRYSENMSHKTVDTKDLYSNYTRESEDYFIKRRKQTRWSLFREKITTIFTTIFSVFTTTYFYVWKMQTSVFSQIHRVASKVMLWDTYLLWKSGSGDKGKKLAWLCLVPLLLFGGWWLLAMGSEAVSGVWSSLTSKNTIPLEVPFSGRLTQEEIDEITLAVKSRLINSPEFVSTNRQQQDVIDGLLQEIEHIRLEMVESKQYMQKINLNMRRCCNRPIINIEGYVAKIVSDLMNNPQFLHNQKGLNSYLHSLFLAKESLEYKLGNITETMNHQLANLVYRDSHLIMDKVASNLGDVHNETRIRLMVKQSLDIYDADKTGMVDYAMENMGGQVVSTRCTEMYHQGKGVVSILGIPLWHLSNSPRTILTPNMAPGDCWAFQNFPGFVVVKLSSKITVEAFSMEHISKLLLPDGKMDSAPKDFEVYGLEEENDKNPVLLGVYKYDYNGDPLQFFLVERQGVYDMIEIRIVSNHGNPNYTCLYRFRVHGKLHKEDER